MKRKKIVAYLKGGLGNQCFIYAAARTHAIKTGAALCFNLDYFEGDRIYRRRYGLDVFDVKGCVLALGSKPVRMFEELRYKIVSGKLRMDRLGNYCCDHLPFRYRPLPLEWHGTLVLDGYWHSYGYYKDGVEVLSHDFALRNADDPIFGDVLYKRIKEDGKSFFCHVRSYKEVPGHAAGDMSAADAYYRKALGIMAEKLGAGATCYLFSDDLEWAAGRIAGAITDCGFSLVKVEGVPGADNQLRDFMLMRSCKNAIIGNSSFSGFAAILAEQTRREEGLGDGVFIYPPNMIEDYFPEKWVSV